MSLEQQITNLTDATTELLESVNVKKTILDDAVIKSKESEDKAKLSESNSLESSVIATTRKIETEELMIGFLNIAELLNFISTPPLVGNYNLVSKGGVLSWEEIV
jgi:hypothetical protein